jgi:hypothetical protein
MEARPSQLQTCKRRLATLTDRNESGISAYITSQNNRKVCKVLWKRLVWLVGDGCGVTGAVTVAVAGDPPARVGDQTVYGVTSVVLDSTESASCELTVCHAFTNTCESEVTADVVMGNVTEVCPAGMVTLPGTLRMPSSDWR